MLGNGLADGGRVDVWAIGGFVGFLPSHHQRMRDINDKI
jgi:hypothetical protein